MPNPTPTELPEFEDAEVQKVYAILCSHEAPPDQREHWEGWIARRIVAELRIPYLLEQNRLLREQVEALNGAIVFVPTGERKHVFGAMEYFEDFDGNLCYFNQPTDWAYCKDNPRPTYRRVKVVALNGGDHAE